MNAREGASASFDQAFETSFEASYMRHLHHSDGGGERTLAPTPDRIALKRALVATDFSRDAARAVDRAAVLADGALISSVAVLHVASESPVSSMHRLLRRNARKKERADANSARKLQAVADEFQRRAGITVDQHVKDGSVVKAIQRYGSETDLVMLGAPGAHPLRDLAIGSTAERVLRRTRKPVLVVRRRAEGPYRRVVVAIDFDVDAGNALAYAQAIAPDAEVNLVHVYCVPYEGKMNYAGVSKNAIRQYRGVACIAAANQMIEFARSQVPSGDVRLLLVHGYAIPELLQLEYELAADLVVLTKRGDSLASDFLLDSVTLQFLHRSQCDVLIVR